MEKKLTKNQKGITLVALIITIIILLILAIVSIRVIKDGGILSKTQSAKETYSEAEEKEKIKLVINQAALDGKGTINREQLEAALTEQFKENFQITEETEEYYKVKIKSSGRIYAINKNGGIEAEEKAITLPQGLEEGSEFEMDADKDGTPETWIVLYKNTDNIEVISKNTMGELELGTNDLEAQEKATDINSDGTIDDKEKALYSYNNVIDRINSYCASIIKIPNEGTRSVGSMLNGEDENISSYIKKTTWTENGETEWKKYGQYGKDKDNNYEADINKMKSLKIANSNNAYWLASRYVEEKFSSSSSTGNVYFGIRYLNSDGIFDMYLYKYLIWVRSTSDQNHTSASSNKKAVRPVVKFQYP